MRELKWLESLAPNPPPVDADQRGNLQLLEIIQENTEYAVSTFAINEHFCQLEDAVQRLWKVAGVRAATC
jgi:hypothetical protein